jgi:hypothetical protein
MKLSDVTAVGRAVDVRYPTNRAIVLLAAAVTAGGTGVRLAGDEAVLDALGWGVRAGLAVFFAWALARELDPDHDLAAFVAAGLMVAGLFSFDLPDLLAMLWWVVALRVVNRSTGLPARILDSAGLLGLGAWLAWQRGWPYGLWTAVAFLIDGLLPAPRRRHLALAGAMVVITGVVVVVQGSPARMGDLPWPMVAAIGATTLLFGVVMVTTRRLRAVCDYTGAPLELWRVWAGQGVALVAALLGAWLAGLGSVVAWLPLWAALLGTGLYRLGEIVIGLVDSQRTDRPGGGVA